METTRNYLTFPYVSKSSYMSWKYGCPYKYEQMYLKGRKTVPNLAMESGTSLHFLFDRFFDSINYDELWEMDWVTAHDTSHSFIYNYFYSILSTFIPEGTINSHILRNVKSFARLEENHWFITRTTTTNKREAVTLFQPMDREKFYKNDEFKMFGTRDRAISETNGRVLLADYKTGNVPKGAELTTLDGKYALKMSDNKVGEGNFYCALWLLEHGYTFKYDSFDARGNKKYNCYKNNKLVKIDFIDFCFVYTDMNPAILTRRKANIVAIRTILNDLDKLRAPNQSFERDPNIMRCRRCQLFQSDCKEFVDFEIYGNVLGRQESTKTDVERPAESN